FRVIADRGRRRPAIRPSSVGSPSAVARRRYRRHVVKVQGGQEVFELLRHRAAEATDRQEVLSEIVRLDGTALDENLQSFVRQISRPGVPARDGVEYLAGQSALDRYDCERRSIWRPLCIQARLDRAKTTLEI